jgi:hypothetical protein
MSTVNPTLSAPMPVATESATKATVAVKRRTVDTVLIALGAVGAVVLFVAGGLLMWGSNFSTNYVHDELTAQQIFFGSADSLKAEGRPDLVKYAGQQVSTGREAQAYANYIRGHLDKVAGGQTYAQLGTPQRAAAAAVTAAKDAGKSADEIAALQAKADALSAQRDTLFKGETLRGLLLSTYAWNTIGEIAFIASICAFVAGAVMVVLVVLGLVHRHHVPAS